MNKDKKTGLLVWPQPPNSHHDIIEHMSYGAPYSVSGVIALAVKEAELKKGGIQGEK